MTPHRCSCCQHHVPVAVLNTHPEAYYLDGGGEFETAALAIGVCGDCISQLAAGKDLEVLDNVWAE